MVIGRALTPIAFVGARVGPVGGGPGKGTRSPNMAIIWENSLLNEGRRTSYIPQTDQQSRPLRKPILEGAWSATSQLVTQDNVSATKPLTDSQEGGCLDRRQQSSSRAACLASNFRYAVVKDSWSRRRRANDSSPGRKLACRLNNSSFWAWRERSLRCAVIVAVQSGGRFGLRNRDELDKS